MQKKTGKALALSRFLYIRKPRDSRVVQKSLSDEENKKAPHVIG